MAKRLDGNLVNLIHEAAARSFHRRKALHRFLRQVGISEPFLSTWTQEESKRELLDRLFTVLQNNPQGTEVLLRMARDLANQDNFPDLLGWEDSKAKIESANSAVSALKTSLKKLNDQIRDEKEQSEARKRHQQIQEEIRRSKQSLENFNLRLKELSTQLGSQQAGYDFQDWFYEFMDFFEIQNRRPYYIQGRQIDGSITISGTTYLVELKFTAEQAGAPEIDIFFKKVTDKADNTMGVMISISGFSSVAIEGASVRGTPILLFDHRHLYFVLSGASTFSELVERVRRHASQTCEAFLLPDQF